MPGRKRICLAGAALLICAPHSLAQTTVAGDVATSSAGRVGQRQAREESVPGVAPMARIDSRIQNRIQSRLRTRIDREYNPSANAVSPFETAADRVRSSGRARRR